MSQLGWAAFVIASAVADHPAASFVEWRHATLQGARREAVLDLMTADVTIYESGKAENSRDEYAGHHLDADMSFARATTTTVEDRRVVEMGDAALVLTRRLPLRTRPPSPGGSAPAPPGEHLSTEGLAAQLQAAGLKVERKGSVRQPFFAVPAKVLAIGTDEIEVFEFATARDAEKAAATVGGDGGTIGTSAMHWMAPPHFHRRDRTILIHLGSTPEVRSAIERIAGAAFAGRR